MADTNFVNGTVIQADWLNDVNDFVYGNTPQSANLINFLQSGSGATTRTVQSKLRDFVSVKDFDAVGNGIADDTNAIKAAITAAGTGTVYFPPGTYLCAGQLGTVACSFIGAGRASSILIYSGSAAPFVSFGDAEYIGLRFEYSNNALTGDFTATFAPSKFSKIYWGSVSNITTAASCLNVNGAVQVDIEMSHLTNAVVALQGQKSGGFANVIRVKECILGNYVAAAIRDGGQGWVIDACGFEPSTTGQTVAIDTTGSLVWEGLEFTGNWLGDVSSSSAFSMLKLRARGAKISGNYFDGANSVHTAIQITGDSQGIAVIGNTFKSFAKIFDLGSIAITDWVSFANHISGGTNYTYSGSPPTGSTIMGLFGNQSSTYIAGFTPQAYTVSTLPSAGSLPSGTKAFVVDSSVTTFNSNVAGGGSNYVPVFVGNGVWKVG